MGDNDVLRDTSVDVDLRDRPEKKGVSPQTRMLLEECFGLPEAGDPENADFLEDLLESGTSRDLATADAKPEPPPATHGGKSRPCDLTPRT